MSVARWATLTTMDGKSRENYRKITVIPATSHRVNLKTTSQDKQPRRNEFARINK